jgi:C4-dicarboxylate-specific signal transduction histidine kinase
VACHERERIGSHEVIMLTTEMRKTGIDVVGDIGWGTHFCLFYETKTDLLDTLVAYCKAGLENDEFCLWVVAAPVREEEAWQALQARIPDLDRYQADGSIEIVAAHDWYLQDGTFKLERVIRGWNEKLARASARGYAGLRVTGDTAWLETKDWKNFCDYEDSVNEAIANQRFAVLCTYPLGACGSGEILDVVRTHQFATARRHGTWDVIETAGYKQAKAQIKRLNDELEQRVVERTAQLTLVNGELSREVVERQRAEERAEAERERLRQARADLAHISRVTAMGELAASLAHEIKQPISAAMTDAQTCLRWLGRDAPDVPEGCAAASRVLKDVSRAAEMIGSVSALFKKNHDTLQPVDVNELIREMTVLLHSEAKHYSIAIRTELAPDLPGVTGNRVQLQQVVLNLVLNGIDAMKNTDRTNELTIASQQVAPDQIVVSITDSGIGIPEEWTNQIFEAFFTTKPEGIGMGLPISRSIIESHGGRLWATSSPGTGATFSFSLPVQPSIADGRNVVPRD